MKNQETANKLRKMEEKYFQILSAEDLCEQSNKFKNLGECYQALKDLKEFDKREGLKIAYVVARIIETKDSYMIREGKVYRRGNKIFWKAV